MYRTEGMLDWKTSTWEAEMFDLVFRSLAHPVRRTMLRKLRTARRTITELSNFNSVESACKHIRVLERAALVRRTRVGRAVYCELTPGALDYAAAVIVELMSPLTSAAEIREPRALLFEHVGKGVEGALALAPQVDEGPGEGR